MYLSSKGQSEAFKIKFFVFMQLFTVTAASMGALNVPTCASSPAGGLRIVIQFMVLLSVLYAIIFTGVSGISKAAPPKSVNDDDKTPPELVELRKQARTLRQRKRTPPAADGIVVIQDEPS